MAAPAVHDVASERRGWHGRWARTGSSTAQAAHEYLKGLTGKVRLRELDEYSTAQYERETLDPIRARYTDEQAEAVFSYVHTSYEINTTARGGELGYRRDPEARTRDRIEAISAAMAPLPDDLMLKREISGGDSMSRFFPGDVIADDGFASTTIRPGRFASGRGGTTVMNILAPRGTPAVWAGRTEDELILDRGTPMVLVSTRPGRRPGVTEQNWLVLPKAITPEGPHR